MNQQFTTVTTITINSSLENDTDFHDAFQDISSGEKRIIRVGTKNFDKKGTYITVKLYKTNEDGVFKCYQAVTLTTREFDCLADNYSKIIKMVKKQTGEKTSSSSSSSSSSSALNDKHHKKRCKSKRSVRPEKECAESGDENEANDEYSNNKKC